MRKTTTALAVAACFGAGLAGSAQANPVGPTVTNGAAQFTTTGNLLTVTNSPNTIINWGSFSIGANEITRFAQQSASSLVLNRVLGQNPSAILGALQSNGRVMLINPNGIVFGAGSQINVAGLTASTLNITDADFLAGRFRFADGLGNAVINNGSITAGGGGGNVYLVGNAVTNNGIITSPNGEVVLAAGNSVELVNPGTPDLRVQISAPDNLAVNLGSIVADSGRVGIYAGLISHGGSINADSVTVGENGQITLQATRNTTLAAGSSLSANGPSGGTVTIQSGDTTLASGTIEAKGSAGQGGSVKVLGNLVGLTDNARIDASGTNGGGSILSGGDFQGKNPGVQNASRSYVGPNVTLKADATQTGDGGKVVVWADDVTRYYGSISAKGGAQSGNGGQVEVSGHNTLDFNGRVDTSAANGNVGTLLLDPSNINIVADAAGPDTTTADTGTPGTTRYFGAATTDTLTVGTLTGALGTTDVTVDATVGGGGNGDINVNTPIAYNSAQALTFKAAGTTTVGAGNTITNNGAGSINFNGNTTINAAVTNTSTGDITFSNFGTDTIAANLTTTGGKITVAGGSATAFFNWTAGTISSGGAPMETFSGNLSTTITGTVTLAGLGWNSGETAGPQTADVTVNTGGQVSIANGATWTVQADTLHLAGGNIVGGGTLQNNATISVEGASTIGDGTTTFNNASKVNFSNPFTLTINAPGSDTGKYDLSATNSGYDLSFSGGARSFTGVNATITSTATPGQGGGAVAFSGGTVTFDNQAVYDDSNILGTTVSNGSVQFPAAMAFTAPLTLSGGLLKAGNVTTNGGFTWSGGAFDSGGTLITNAAATVSGGVTLTRDWTLLGPGTLGANGTISINGGNTWTIGNTAGASTTLALQSTRPPSQISGLGTLLVNTKGIVSVEAGTTISAKQFINDGTVNVGVGGANSLTVDGDFPTTVTETGTYNLAGIGGAYALTFFNGTRSFVGAKFTAAASSTGSVKFTSGAITMDAGTSYDDQNMVDTTIGLGSAAQITFNNDVTFNKPLTVTTNASVSGSGNLIAADTLNWPAGTIGGSGTLTTSSKVDLTGNTNVAINRPWIWSGTDGTKFIYSGGTTIGGGGTFANRGSITVAGDLGLNIPGKDTNGTYTVNTGSTLSLAGGAREFDATTVADGGGTLSFNGAAITGTGAVQITSLNWTGGSFDNAGISLKVNGAATVSVGNTPILLNNPVNDFSTITLNNSGANDANVVDANAISVGASSVGGSLGLQAPGGITLTGNQTSGLAQTYQDKVTLGADVTLASSGSGNISFNNTVNGAQALTVNTAGTTTFGGVVGGTTKLSSLTTDATGTTAINTTGITTTGGQSYGDALTLGANTTLDAGTSTLNLGAVTGGGFNLTTASAASVASASGLGALLANGSLSTGGGVTATSVTVNGPATLGGDITTSGNQSYGGTTLAAASIKLAANGGAGSIDLGTVTGAGKDLTLTGLASIGSTLNNIGALTANNTLTTTGAIGASSVSVTGAATLGGDVTSTGNQSYGSTILSTLNVSLSANGGAGTLALGNVDGADNNLNLTGDATITRTVGNLGALTANQKLITGGAIGAANVTVAGVTTLGGDMTTSGNQDYTGAVNLNGPSVTLKGATPTFTAGVIGAGKSLTLNFSGPATVDGATFTGINALTVNSSGSTTLKGTLTTIGDITLTGAVNGNNVGLNAGGGNIAALNAANDFTGALSLSGGTVQVNDTTGGLTLGILNTGALSLTAGGGGLNLGGGTVGGALNAKSNNNPITQAGALTVAGNAIIDAGTSTITLPDTGNKFQGASNSFTGSSVTLANDGALGMSLVAGTTYDLTAGGNLSVAGDAAALKLTTTSGGTTRFTAATAVAGDLTVASAGAVSQGGTLAVGGVSKIDAGTSAIALTNAGNDFTGAVTIKGSAVQVTDANAMTVNFTTGSGGTVFIAGKNGAAGGDLVVTGGSTSGGVSLISQAGVVSVTGALTGGTTSLSGSAGISLAADVTASGSLRLLGPITLGADVMLTNSGGQFIDTGSGALNGNGHALTLNTGGDTVIGGAVSGLATLTTDAGGSTFLNGGSVTTSGAQIYGDAVTLGGNTTLAGNGVTFLGTLDGARSLTVNDSGITRFGGSVGGTTPLASLTTDGAGTTALNGGTVLTSGAQIYNDAVLLGKTTTLNGGDVTFAGTLNGAQALTVNAGGATTFGSAVGATTALTALTTDAAGTTAINGGAITVNGPIALNDAVSGKAVTLNAGGNAVTATNGGNDFSGTLTVQGGTLRVADANSLDVALIASGAATLSAGGNLTVAGKAAGLTTTSMGGGTVFGAPDTTVAGNLNVTSAGAVTQAGPLTVSGTTTINAPGSAVTLAGANDFGGTLTVTAASATLNDVNALTAVLNTGGANRLTAAGAIDASGSFSDFSAAGSGAGAGITAVSSAPLLTVRDVTTSNGAIALSNTGGDLVLNGIITPGSSTLTTAASGSQTLAGGTLTVANYTVGGSGIALAGGSLVITKTLTVAPGATLTGGAGSVTAPAATIAGVLNPNGGTVGITSVNIVAGGKLVGTGTVGGTVNNDGIVAPGNSPGLLNIAGDFVQGPTGLLSIELGGTSPGTQYDRLAVAGNTVLDGTLGVAQFGGFVPAPGDRFRFITTAGTSSGAFASVLVPPAFAGMSIDYRTAFTELTAGVFTSVSGSSSGSQGALDSSLVAATDRITVYQELDVLPDQDKRDVFDGMCR